MIFAFWWSGRGYLTALIVLGTLSASGIILQASRSVIDDRLWFWGTALVAAAALNWHVGTKVNRRKLSQLAPRGLRERLLYRARNRFMSLPMETFSIVIGLSGVAIIGFDLAA